MSIAALSEEELVTSEPEVVPPLPSVREPSIPSPEITIREKTGGLR